MSKKAKIFLLCLLALLAAGVFYRSYWSNRSYTSYVPNRYDESNWSNSPAPTRYTNAKYGFSFEKPAGYSIGAVPDAIGETLVVQSGATPLVPSTPEGNAVKGLGFQIYITPLDEPVELTPAFIKTDLPGTSVVNPLKIKLDDKADGIMFESNSSAFGGKSYEIWLTYNGRLYQITSYASFAEELKKIVGTWKFQ